MAEIRSTLLFDKMAVAFSTDADIKAFVDTHWTGKPYYVYIGFEAENAPDESTYPLIAAHAIERGDKGENPMGNVIEIKLGLAISTRSLPDQGLEETQVTDGPTLVSVVRKYKGIFLIEEFRILAENALYKLKGIGAKIDSVGETVVDNLYPNFESSTVITFSYPRNYRSNRIKGVS